MTRSLADIAGHRFGKLVAVLPVAMTKSGAVWLFQCDCGEEKQVRLGNVRNGHTSSCGCLHRQKAKEANTTHNMSRTAVYKVWAAMVGRCCNPDDAGYPHYGGRGINVAQRWRESFAAFIEDMGPRPTANHSIERLDNDGNYEPGNCVWLVQKEQGQNTRRVRRFRFRGSHLTIRQLSLQYGIPHRSLLRRIDAGWPIERAVLEPLALKGSRAGKSQGEAA